MNHENLISTATRTTAAKSIRCSSKKEKRRRKLVDGRADRRIAFKPHDTHTVAFSGRRSHPSESKRKTPTSKQAKATSSSQPHAPS